VGVVLQEFDSGRFILLGDGQQDIRWRIPRSLSMPGPESLQGVLADGARLKSVRESWSRALTQAASGSGSISAEEVSRQTSEFLDLFAAALRAGSLDIAGSAWQPVRELLERISHSRAVQGFTAADTAAFIFSLKLPLFEQLGIDAGNDARLLADNVAKMTTLVDSLGMHTVKVFQKTREEVIRRQQEEMLELSTPVVKLWEGILALPMVGTLDSARTQVVMESLLNRIVETGSQVAILDITGVPTVDTLVAQHLLKTVTALRLMGAECIISGVRPQIAQTIVHLGVDLQGVTTRANLADALALALKQTGATLG
jgi:rsbT co-antagonist protein RsbR